jgi:hypothetical protein
MACSGGIEPTLEAAETRRLADPPTNDLTALDFYLRALPDSAPRGRRTVISQTRR